MEQLAILGKKPESRPWPSCPAGAGRYRPPRDVRRQLGGFDVLILDTAGRTTLDER